MRLQLIVAAAVLWAAPTHAQQGAEARVDSYDDGWITVISPRIDGRVTVNETVEVSGGYDVDILSGATPVSVDAVSSATRFEEVRHAADFGGTFGLGDSSWSLSSRYQVSIEPDFVTHAVSLGATGDLLQKMATLGLTYRIWSEQLGSVHDERLTERSLGQSLDVSWTHVLGRTTTITGTLSGELRLCPDSLGCMVSPYRYVPVHDRGVGTLLSVAERHPDTRIRGAASLRLAQYLGAGVALHLDYRFYGDSWRVNGHTGALALAWGGFAERLIVKLEGRGSWQSAATFWSEHYASLPDQVTAPEYRTGDRELSGLWNVMAVLRVRASLLSVGPLARLGLNLRVGHAWYRYPNYDPLPELGAWIAGGGVHAEW